MLVSDVSDNPDAPVSIVEALPLAMRSRLRVASDAACTAGESTEGGGGGSFGTGAAGGAFCCDSPNIAPKAPISTP